MGWINTVLDVATLGAEIAQVGRLDDLKKQGATAALIQAVLQEIRNQIFNYKQAAQAILEQESTSPKLVAGAMRLLELRLESSGITPDMFPELSDKEYVANTIKFITDNRQRIVGQFSVEERNEIESMARAAQRLPEYRYYIDNQANYVDYKNAKVDYERAGPLANGVISAGLGCVLFIAATFVVGIFASLFPKSPTVGMAIGLIVSLVGIYLIGKRVRKGKEAKKRMEALDKELDLILLERLDHEFGGDQQKAIDLRNQAAEMVKDFFGDSPMLPVQ